MTHPMRQPKSTMLAVRLPTELADALRKFAEENERSVSGELRLAVKRHLEAGKVTA
jgi:hypothetical protein